MTKQLPAPTAIIAHYNAGSFCLHCGGARPEAHEHRWQPPERCNEHLVLEDAEYRCERDAGHDSGEFPRFAWDDGRHGVRRFLTDPTPHVVSWGP